MQFSPDQLLTTTVHDKSGHKVGKVQQVYLDDATGAPSWVTVRTGIFGTNESLVPVDSAELNGDLLQVPFDRQVIHDAPNFDPGHHLDEADEDELYRYYGMSRQLASTPRSTGGRQADRERPEEGQDAIRGQRGHHDQIGGEPVAQPSAHPDPVSRGEAEQVSGDQASGEFVSGPASAGDHEQRGERRGPDDSDSSATDNRDSSNPDPSHERELLQRERDLLDRERELLDRERELAEQEGAVRPRLRRHDPGTRS